jgi:hypothetical protein
MVTALWGPVRFRFHSRDPKLMQNLVDQVAIHDLVLILARDSEERP